MGESCPEGDIKNHGVASFLNTKSKVNTSFVIRHTCSAKKVKLFGLFRILPSSLIYSRKHAQRRPHFWYSYNRSKECIVTSSTMCMHYMYAYLIFLIPCTYTRSDRRRGTLETIVNSIKAAIGKHGQ